MMTQSVTIRARFDGKVFIPESAVDVPRNESLVITVSQPATAHNDEDRPLLRLMKALDGLPSDPNAPTDGASQHDHYLYGTPKRENP